MGRKGCGDTERRASLVGLVELVCYSMVGEEVNDVPTARDPIERAVAAFRARVEAADVPFDDPEAAGSDAADFVVARYGRRHQVAERVGPVYTTDDLARYLVGPQRPLTTEAVRKRAKQRQLVSFTSGDGLWLFPAWQFTTIGGHLEPMAGVVELWRRLPHDSVLDALDLVMWAATPLRSLDGETPARWAATRGAGDPALAQAVARLRGRAAGRAA